MGPHPPDTVKSGFNQAMLRVCLGALPAGQRDRAGVSARKCGLSWLSVFTDPHAGG